MSQASPAKEPSIPSKEPSMEEILASIRRIIESGEERPALAQRTRERLAASAARNEAERATSREFDASAQADDAPQPRLFAPANGMQRSRDGAVAIPAAAPSDIHVDQASRATDKVDADPMATAFEEPNVDGSEGWALGLEDAAVGMAGRAQSQDESRPARVESPGSHEDDASTAAALVLPVHADRSDRHNLAEIEHDALAVVEAEPVEPSGSATSTLPMPGRVPEAVTAPMDDGSRASFAELPDFSLEFDEEGFSAALCDEVGFAATFAQRPDAGLAEALAEAADASAPAFSAPTSVIAETSSLMSAEAGAQVAAAFDDLAGAIRDGQMKSMEEMTRQMLRPMLQEWLDDHLPRLVEKLVREEIERVSRGGRR